MALCSEKLQYLQHFEDLIKYHLDLFFMLPPGEEANNMKALQNILKELYETTN